MPADACPIRVLVADDERNFTQVLRMELGREGYAVDVAGNGREALTRLGASEYDVLLLDLKMPEVPGIEVLRELHSWEAGPEVIVLTGHATVPTAIEAMKLGAYDYLTKPCKTEELALLVRKAAEKRRLLRENRLLRARAERTEAFPHIVTQDPSMRAVLQMLVKIAPTDSAVLIQGESGTGKELVANAIHQQSGRKEGPFVVINCGALQETVLESELFGHEKGAFTGAVAAKPGLFELADGGTLFLDEIGEVSSAMQVRLLRVIETGRFFRVGGVRERSVDVRILSATNKDLRKAMEAGAFRQDLFYRVAMITVSLPPLRDRRGDIPLLVQHILEQQAALGRKGVSPEALELLTAYAWPGNVRELQHVLRRALILAPADRIGPEDLPLDLRIHADSPAANPPPVSGRLTTLEDIEREHIVRVLTEVKGHRGRAAEILGIDPKTLYRKIRAYRITDPRKPTL
ncbi:MAG TPA: sigma-54 dependent transcriptional regulator [Candidatus Methylomirabilis sp.]|jgi:DNA-binding NtrC family response regulator|nr:sigma-54 dependent transcriptional regulator [Candidatus Methylomirabilis sp.]